MVTNYHETVARPQNTEQADASQTQVQYGEGKLARSSKSCQGKTNRLCGKKKVTQSNLKRYFRKLDVGVRRAGGGERKRLRGKRKRTKRRERGRGAKKT